MISYCYMHNTPVGTLLLATDSGGLRYLLFRNATGASCSASVEPQSDWTEDAAALAETTQQLSEYFAGERTEFELRLNPQGTDFQKSVWNALRSIPYGVTKSYGEIAARIGRPKASRAVGAANGRNPISIIVPCHRVIGSSGKLTGFGGGIDRKQILLDLEQGQRSLAFDRPVRQESRESVVGVNRLDALTPGE